MQRVKGSIDPRLDQAVNMLVDGMNEAMPDGSARYSLDQQLAILDRKIKIESLKLKIDPDEDGAAFRRSPRADDHDRPN